MKNGSHCSASSSWRSTTGWDTQNGTTGRPPRPFPSRQTGRASNHTSRCPPSPLLREGVEPAAASGAAAAVRNLTKSVASLVWTNEHNSRD